MICVATDFEQGDLDLRRFRRRHGHLWGLAGLPTAQETGAAEVVRGVAHVDEPLARQLAARNFRSVDYAGASRRSRAQIGDR